MEWLPAPPIISLLKHLPWPVESTLCSRRQLASKTPDFCYPSLHCGHISGTVLKSPSADNRTNPCSCRKQFGTTSLLGKKVKDLTISCRQTRDGLQVSLQSGSLLPHVPAQSNTAGYECGTDSGPGDFSRPLSLRLLPCPHSCVSPAPGPSHPAAASPLPWAVPPTMTVAWRCRGRGQGVWET